jgi:hypothetical protein
VPNVLLSLYVERGLWIVSARARSRPGAKAGGASGRPFAARVRRGTPRCGAHCCDMWPAELRDVTSLALVVPCYNEAAGSTRTRSCVRLDHPQSSS